jgi:hypothetical protein
MSGKEIKDYILEKDDIYYNIVILNETNKVIKFDDIINERIYDFIKLEELTIGSGMVLAYYQIK